jgi:HEAT repeat protein
VNEPARISLQQLVDALLDVDTLFNPRYLYRFSDLEPAEIVELARSWPQVPAWRRQAVMEDLEKLGERDSLLSFEAICVYAMTDADANVRELALRSLWEYDLPGIIPSLLVSLQSDEAANVRAAAASALGKYVYMGELEELKETTLHEIEDRLMEKVRGSDAMDVRRRALESLGFSSRSEVPALIEKAYTSGDESWLISSLYAMGRSANLKWGARLMKMLDHDSPDVRVVAVQALGELELKEARSRLLELLQDEDVEVRMASAWSLSQIGGEGVQAALEALYEVTEDEDDAEYIASALENLVFTDEMGDLPLLDFLDDEEGDDLFDLIEDDEDQLD